jgi:hypothetical protein
MYTKFVCIVKNYWESGTIVWARSMLPAFVDTHCRNVYCRDQAAKFNETRVSMIPLPSDQTPIYLVNAPVATV